MSGRYGNVGKRERVSRKRIEGRRTGGEGNSRINRKKRGVEGKRTRNKGEEMRMFQEYAHRGPEEE